VLMAAGSRRAREDGLGALFSGGAGTVQLGIAGVTTLAAAFFLLGMRGGWSVLASGLLTLVLRAWFHRRLGGVTGDVIGCASELNEILCLLMLIAMFGVVKL
jgi:adenosylcobinamide-GDP ribazoletransferase